MITAMNWIFMVDFLILELLSGMRNVAHSVHLSVCFNFRMQLISMEFGVRVCISYVRFLWEFLVPLIKLFSKALK